LRPPSILKKVQNEKCQIRDKRFSSGGKNNGHKVVFAYRAKTVCQQAEPYRIITAKFPIDALWRFVAVDGTFLKARFVLILLLAVGIDANGETIVLAWTTVLFQAVRAKDPVFDPVILQVGLAGITSFDAIVEQLTEYERRIGEQPLKESAFTADPKEGRDANQKTGKTKSGAGFKVRCFHCNKVGHRKSECRTLKQGASTGPLAMRGGSKGLSPPQEDAYVASESSWLATTTANSYESVSAAGWKPEGQAWVIDSGCTRHMTYSKDAFLEYTPLHPPIGVNIAKGMRRLNTCTRCILRTSSSLLRVCRANIESRLELGEGCASIGSSTGCEGIYYPTQNRGLPTKWR
jgi:hypothetical protein